MPLPATNRFDASDRRALRISLLGALGPLLTFAVLVTSYALSARACVGWARPSIGAALGLGLLGCAAASWRLVRESAAEGGRLVEKPLRLAALWLQLFCLFVIVGYAIALMTEPSCG
jgi:hypothetical protein